MDIIDSILGNTSEPDWKARLQGASIDWLELSQWDAQKNRFRKTTKEGRELAVALERGQSLRDGDVLDWNEDSRKAVVCRIRLCPVMVVDMQGLTALPREEALAAAVKLGHALGNQHWPAVVKGSMVYVPVFYGQQCHGLGDGHSRPAGNILCVPGRRRRARSSGTAGSTPSFRWCGTAWRPSPSS